MQDWISFIKRFFPDDIAAETMGWCGGMGGKGRGDLGMRKSRGGNSVMATGVSKLT